MIGFDTIFTLIIVLLGNFAVFILGVVLGVHLTKQRYEVKEDGTGDNKQDILDGVSNSN